MNKQDQQNGAELSETKQTKPGLATRKMAETMAEPGFGAEQLPELWQQITETGGAPLESPRRDQWNEGIEAMYERCETYPQHTKLTSVFFGLPPDAWHVTVRTMTQARTLLRRATQEQLQQAIEHEQLHYPEKRKTVSNHILIWANVKQLTRPIVEQLEWDSRIAVWATWPDETNDDHARWRHISELVQQQLLEGDTDAWTVFLGIAEHGNTIGETAELAKAIEHI